MRNTGAKAPSLYQRFSMFGTPNLRPEHNIGVDAGIDAIRHGGGGGGPWKDKVGEISLGEIRIKEAMGTGAMVIATARPPSDRSCAALAALSRMSPRTKSPFSRSSIRSKVSRLAITCCGEYALAPSTRTAW